MHRHDLKDDRAALRCLDRTRTKRQRSDQWRTCWLLLSDLSQIDHLSATVKVVVIQLVVVRQ